MSIRRPGKWSVDQIDRSWRASPWIVSLLYRLVRDSHGRQKQRRASHRSSYSSDPAFGLLESIRWWARLTSSSMNSSCSKVLLTVVQRVRDLSFCLHWGPISIWHPTCFQNLSCHFSLGLPKAVYQSCHWSLLKFQEGEVFENVKFHWDVCDE